MSSRNIEERIRVVYNFDVSTSTISRITDAVSSKIIDRKNPIRTRLFNRLDGWHCFKVRENSKKIEKTIYIAVALNCEEKKEILECG